MANEVNNSGSVGAKSGKSVFKNYSKDGFIPNKQLNGFNDVNKSPGGLQSLFTRGGNANPERQKNYINNRDNQYFFQNGIQTKTGLDEDPVIFGIDLVIDSESNLFKGVEGFIRRYSADIDEVKSREGVYSEFISELSKYFGKDDYASKKQGALEGKIPFGNFKVHYIKSVSGLDGLVEKTLGGLKTEQQFVKWTEDAISIDMWEDTYLNVGYLSYLYRILSYSRISGKTIIPDNLLRFDMKIIISEVRNFNRININSSVEEFQDNVSRYVYSLYDCQFNFKTMTHGDEVKMSEPSVMDSYKFDIVYKFSTLKLEKFKISAGDKEPNIESERSYFDNRYSGLKTLGDDPETPQTYDDPYLETEALDSSGGAINYPKRTQGSSILNSGSPEGIIENEKAKAQQNNQYSTPAQQSSELDGLENSNNLGSIYESNLQDISDAASSELGQTRAQAESLSNANVINASEEGGLSQALQNTKNEIARRWKFKRDQLINDTISKIRTATGMRRISSPINVYQDPTIVNFAFNQFKDFVNDQISDFIANSPIGTGGRESRSEMNQEYNNRVGGELSNPGLESKEPHKGGFSPFNKRN